MKKILRGVLVLCVLAFIAFVVFYFWASSPTQSQEDYAQMITYDYKPVITHDSIYSIVTYNIGYLSGMTNNRPVDRTKAFLESNMNLVLDQFELSDPDIIVFQEIDYDATRSYSVNQQDEIAKLGYPYAAKAINWDKHYVPFPYWPLKTNFGKVISGQSVLSKYPLSDHERIVLSRVGDNPFYRDAFYLDRLAQVVTVNLDGREVKVINVHLEAFDKPTRAVHTDAVLKLYRQYAKDYPTILIGDFNSDPEFETPTINKILSQTDIGNAAYTLDNHANTFDTADPFKRIDFIFYSKNTIDYVDGRVINSFAQASDHLPVEMRFRLK
ncbi:MAG: endonuclease/exonuclease/phosphatase [Flavobacteriales bacterium]|nr:MAG: endonuclease/exonuclease/phosphatase [Flavobacteriales bacterium]